MKIRRVPDGLGEGIPDDQITDDYLGVRAGKQDQFGPQINVWLAHAHPETLLTGSYEIDCWVAAVIRQRDRNAEQDNPADLLVTIRTRVGGAPFPVRESQLRAREA